MAGRKNERIQIISLLTQFFFVFSFIIAGIALLLRFAQVNHAQMFHSTKTLGEDILTSAQTANVIYNGARDKKQIALTFDADMTYGMDRDIHTGAVKSYINRDLIQILIQTNTPATLFLSGLWIKDYPVETRYLASNPLFELANHSYSHPSFEGYCYGLPKMEPLTMEDEIDLTQELLKEYTGKDNSYFRFPGGCISQAALDYMGQKGIKTIQWDVVGGDGFNENTESIVKSVLDNVQNGSIIVLHMNGYPNDPKTTEALPEIISTLKNRGYEFVKLSDLLE